MALIRFAPAASGEIHLGNLRILLANYLLCECLNLEKEILLRVDFQSGVSVENEENLIATFINILKVFQLSFKFNIIKQRDRFNRYYEVIDLLIKNNCVYENNGVFYLNIKYFYSINYIVRFYDLLLGSMYKCIEYINNPIIYSKNKGLFFYNFMSVVDDIDFGIKYVVRGNDHIDNTYVQIIMFDILKRVITGSSVPNFLHVPMCVSRFGKLSKSSSCDFSLKFFLKHFIFPSVMKDCLISSNSSISSIGKAQKRLDFEEIKWMNIRYLRKTCSVVINESLLLVWDIKIDIVIIEKFKFFVNCVEDLVMVYNVICKFTNKEIIINSNQKSDLLILYENNDKLSLYKSIGNIFGYEYLGKEFLNYFGLDCLFNS